MKKIFLSIVSVLIIAGGGIYLFRGQLWEKRGSYLSVVGYTALASATRTALGR